MIPSLNRPGNSSTVTLPLHAAYRHGRGRVIRPNTDMKVYPFRAAVEISAHHGVSHEDRTKLD